MKILAAILWKEFLQLVRNKELLILLFACPVSILGIVPFALENNTRINAGIVDYDRTPVSRSYAGMMVHSPEFAEVRHFPTIESAERSVKLGQTKVILVIPPDHERQLNRFPPGDPMNLAIEATHPKKAQHLLATTTALFSEAHGAGSQHNKEAHQETGANQNVGSPHKVEAHQANIHNLFNPEASYQYYYLVSLLVLVQTIIGCCLLNHNIISEKEKGVLAQFNSTSLNRYLYIAGKGLFAMFVYLAISLVSLTFCRLVYGLTVQGNFEEYLLVTILYSFPMLSLGYLAAVLTKNQVQTIYLLILLLLTMILMSTMFTSLDSMPEWARLTRFFNPVYYMLDISRLIILKGVQMKHFITQAVMMTATGLMLSAAAVLIMRKSPERW